MKTDEKNILQYKCKKLIIQNNDIKIENYNEKDLFDITQIHLNHTIVTSQCENYNYIFLLKYKLKHDRSKVTNYIHDIFCYLSNPKLNSYNPDYDVIERLRQIIDKCTEDKNTVIFSPESGLLTWCNFDQ